MSFLLATWVAANLAFGATSHPPGTRCELQPWPGGCYQELKKQGVAFDVACRIKDEKKLHPACLVVYRVTSTGEPIESASERLARGVFSAKENERVAALKELKIFEHKEARLEVARRLVDFFKKLPSDEQGLDGPSGVAALEILFVPPIPTTDIPFYFCEMGKAALPVVKKHIEDERNESGGQGLYNNSLSCLLKLEGIDGVRWLYQLYERKSSRLFVGMKSTFESSSFIDALETKDARVKRGGRRFLSQFLGKDLGDDPKAWRDWLRKKAKK